MSGVVWQAGLAPEDAGGVFVDLGEELVEPWGGLDHVVAMPAAVAVRAVEPPEVVGRLIAQLGDGLARPIGSEIGLPGRSALEDGDALPAHIALDAHLVTVLSGDLVLAIAAHRSERGVGDARPRRHPARLERLAQLARRHDDCDNAGSSGARRCLLVVLINATDREARTERTTSAPYGRFTRHLSEGRPW